MGNNCSSIGTASTRNVCSESIDGTLFNSTYSDFSGIDENSDNNYKRSIFGFCTYSGVAGKSYRTDWCSRIGQNSEEWEYDDKEDNSQGSSCHYDDCEPYRYQPSGCCNGCCGIIGKGVKCKRKAFMGDAAQCCLNDYRGCANYSGEEVGTSDLNLVSLCFSDVKNGEEGGNKCVNDNLTGGDCQNTCDPCQRDITGSPHLINSGDCTPRAKYCSDVLTDYCSGNDLPPGDSSWIERWLDEDGTPLQYGCLNVILRDVYAPPQPSGIATKGTPAYSDNDYATDLTTACKIVEGNFKAIQSDPSCTPLSLVGSNPEGIVVASNILTATTNRYSQDGFIIGTLPGMPGYNPFQDFLYNDICCKFPILCQGLLKDTCGQYSSQQMADNPSIANWCGCYLPAGEYSTYEESYQLEVPCTPLCNRPTAIPLINFENQPIRCNQDSCIIDDLAIQLANTNVNGTISINQMCGNCHNGITNPGEASSCNCLISSNSVNITNSNIQNLINSQQCTTTNCTVIDPITNEVLSVPCDQVDEQQEILNQQEDVINQQRLAAARTRNRNILLFIAGVILVVVAIGFLIRPNLGDLPEKDIKRKSSDPTGRGGPSSEPTSSFGGFDSNSGSFTSGVDS